MKLSIHLLTAGALLATGLFLNACSKKSNSSPTSANFPNSIKVSIDGKQYVAKGWKTLANKEPQDFVTGYLEKLSSGTSFIVLTTSGVNHDFSMRLDVNGPASGTGEFSKAMSGNFKELFQGGEAYDIVDGSANVTEATPDRLTGTFSLNIENPQRSKTVTGTFDINEPDGQ